MKKHAKLSRFRPLKGGEKKAMATIVKILRPQDRWWFFDERYENASPSFQLDVKNELLARIERTLIDYGIVSHRDRDVEKHHLDCVARGRRVQKREKTWRKENEARFFASIKQFEKYWREGYADPTTKRVDRVPEHG